MLNLHAPFRRAASGDESGIAKLAGESGAASLENTVVADETGRITAVLTGEPEGETWRITALGVAPERRDELAPRILAVADALAADEGILSVTLDARGFGQEMLAILDQEGFRPVQDGAGQGGSRTLVRPVVPQG
jgi:hypothetical protein